MVVVAIIGLLMALAAPDFSAWIKNTRTRGAAESVLSGIQMARSEAVRRNTTIVFTLLPTANDNLLWSVGCKTVVAVTCPALIHTRAKGEGSVVSSGGALQVTFDLGADTTVEFTNFGRPAVARTLNVDSSDSYTGKRPLRILVGAGGATRLCDPYSDLPSTNPLKCP